ncbi:tail sheath [Xanthomonas phage RTH11]|nr:tail sheath [Xanthomonas phage RTH11]
MYRLTLVNRLDAESTVNVTETLSGEQSLDFAFKAGAINAVNDQEISLEDIFMDAYQSADPASGMSPIYGDFGKIKVYHSNLEALLALVASTEAPLGLLPELEIDEDSNSCTWSTWSMVPARKAPRTTATSWKAPPPAVCVSPTRPLCGLLVVPTAP